MELNKYQLDNRRDKIKYLSSTAEEVEVEEPEMPEVEGYQSQFSPGTPGGFLINLNTSSKNEDGTDEAIEAEVEEMSAPKTSLKPASQKAETPKPAEQTTNQNTPITRASVKSSSGKSYHYKLGEEQKFKKDLYEVYVKVLRQRGISTAFAKYLVAQDIWETGWGKKYAGKWNFGNITKGSTWKGSTTRGGDKDGWGNPITQEFRNYDTIEDYVNDKINILSNSNYQAFSGTPEEFADRVGAGGYVGKDNPAHIKDYVDKINGTATSIGLAQQGMKLPNPKIAYLSSYNYPEQDDTFIPSMWDNVENPYAKEIPYTVTITDDSQESIEPEEDIETPTSTKMPSSILVPPTKATTEPSVSSQVTAPVTKGKITFKRQGINVGNMQPVLDRFAEAGISLRVTSGLRKPGEAGKAGNRSHHVRGNAVDVTPGEGETWDTIRAKIKADKSLQKWMKDRGYGIIDETVAATKKKTGATGDHFHIGPDRWAVREFAQLFCKLGGQIPPVLLYSTKNPRN